MTQRNITIGPRSKLLHIEAPGCIINIQAGLHDADGREVTRISVTADGNRYSGDPEWWIEGEAGNNGLACRVICTGLSPAGR